MKRNIILVGLLSLFIAYSPAHAGFMMSEMIIDFAADDPNQHDVKIISQDEETQYIVAETYLVENPRDKNEKRILMTNPQESGLMVTPNKMVLGANSEKLMRFLLIKPHADEEKIFRVAVKPVIGEVETEEQRLALKILVGYEALVIVRPQDAKVDLESERKGNTLTITNNGNTNAYLQSGKQCNATGGDCKDLNVSRIYAGQSWTTTLPHTNGKVQYQVWDGKETKLLSF